MSQGINERERAERHARFKVALEGGVRAGVVAGAVLALLRLLVLSEVALLIAYVSHSRHSLAARWGRSLIWAGLKFPAYPLVGERSLDPGFNAVVALGVGVHLLCSIAWGVLFGLAAVGCSPSFTVALGLLWGTAAWFVESQLLSHLMPHGFGIQPGLLPIFLIYGVALARSFSHYEKHRGWPVWRRSSSAPAG